MDSRKNKHQRGEYRDKKHRRKTSRSSSKRSRSYSSSSRGRSRENDRRRPKDSYHRHSKRDYRDRDHYSRRDKQQRDQKRDKDNKRDLKETSFRTKEPSNLPPKKPVDLSTFTETELAKWGRIQESRITPAQSRVDSLLAETCLNPLVDKLIERENQELDHLEEEALLGVGRKNSEGKEDQAERKERWELAKKLREKELEQQAEEMENIEEDLEVDEFGRHNEKGEIVEEEEDPIQKPVEKEEVEEESGDNSSFDMFADDNSPKEGKEKKKSDKPSSQIAKAREMDFDDEENYYRYTINEVINGDFKILSLMGKGMYGSVLKCQQLSTGRVVAIKLLRNSDITTQAGEREIAILKKLNETDIYDKKHILRLLGNFVYRGHLCLVFEILDLNLRDTLTLYGKRVGLSLAAVRSYAYQLFIALYHLKKNKMVHLDIKPDNLMITQDKKKCKLIDFGNALEVEQVPRITELLARYYKGPEVILGVAWEYSIDMWSAACSIFELYTGSPLFNGLNDNQMLRQMMELRGAPNQKLLKKGLFVQDHFDMASNTFLSIETDPLTRDTIVKEVPIASYKGQNLNERLSHVEIKVTLPVHTQQRMKKEQQDFKDLLEKCLMIDPERRATPEEALRHKFFKKSSQKTK